MKESREHSICKEMHFLITRLLLYANRRGKQDTKSRKIENLKERDETQFNVSTLISRLFIPITFPASPHRSQIYNSNWFWRLLCISSVNNWKLTVVFCKLRLRTLCNLVLSMSEINSFPFEHMLSPLLPFNLESY